MDEKEKRHIISHKVYLLDTLTYDEELVAYLEMNGHIGKADIEKMNAKERNGGNSAAVSELLRILVGRPGSYQSLAEAAEKARQMGAVKILEGLEGYISPQAPLFNFGGPQRASTTTTDQTDHKSPQISTVRNSTSISTNDPEFQKVLDFIIDRQPLDVVLEPLIEGSHMKWENSYDMPSEQLGLAFILNIYEFDDDDKYKKRVGSERDVEYLCDLFTQLRYKIYPISRRQREQPKKTKEEIKVLLQQFRDICNNTSPPPSSIVVFIGSHGRHPNQIVTSDSKSLDLFEDIVQEFYHENCSSLIGKPKIFLVQACQVFEERSQEDSARRTLMQDALICTAGMPGDIVLRDTYKGSYFIYCFVYMMMKHVKDTSFQDIMVKVQDMMKNIQAHREIDQVPGIMSYNFDRKLFFRN